MTCDSVRPPSLLQDLFHSFSTLPETKWLILLFVKPQQERPCTRCIKRNIGHLCHDEPREPVKRTRSEHETPVADEEGSSNNDFAGTQNMSRNLEAHETASEQLLPETSIPLPPVSVDPSHPIQSQAISTAPGQGIDVNPQHRE